MAKTVKSTPSSAFNINDIIDDTVDGNDKQLDLTDAKPMETAPSVADQAVEDEEKAKAARAEKQKFERDRRLDEIKQDGTVMACRLRYLLEAAGIERFQQIYRISGGIATVVFQTVSQEDLILITNQMARDLQRKRWMFDVENSTLISWYRLACSIRSFKIQDPRNNQTLIQFERSDWELPKPTDEKDFDLLPRKLYEHLTTDIVKTQTMSVNLYQQFNQFEQLMRDLAFLLEEDADFFYADLTTDSSPPAESDSLEAPSGIGG